MVWWLIVVIGKHKVC